MADEEAAQVADSNNIPQFQTSAKSATNVDKAFKTLLNNIVNNERLKEKIMINDKPGHNVNRLGSIRLEHNRFEIDAKDERKS